MLVLWRYLKYLQHNMKISMGQRHLTQHTEMGTTSDVKGHIYRTNVRPAMAPGNEVIPAIMLHQAGPYLSKKFIPCPRFLDSKHDTGTRESTSKLAQNRTDFIKQALLLPKLADFYMLFIL